MKILMISKDGDGLGILHKLAQEGHETKVFFTTDGKDKALKNIVGRSRSWRPDAGEWADLVIGDMVGLGNFQAKLNRLNVPSIGFNRLGDVAELDRERQMQLLTKLRVGLPEWVSFDSPSEALSARAVIESMGDNGVVIKPSGNIETGKTQVIKDMTFLEWALDQYDAKQPLVVQEFVDGIEVSTEGWFNGRDWLSPFNHTMEEKRFMNDDLGPNTGCMGNIVWLARSKRDIFVEELRKLSPFLKQISYVGPVDLNCIANKNGVFGLELTMRFGYDAIEALHSLHEGDFGQFLLDLSHGVGDEMRLRDEFSCAVRLSIPPFPFGEPEDGLDVPVSGVKETDESVYLTDVYLENGQLFWSNVDGVLMKVTGTSPKLPQAIEKAYGVVKKVVVPSLQYRTDIGVRVGPGMKRLRSWGYI